MGRRQVVRLALTAGLVLVLGALAIPDALTAAPMWQPRQPVEWTIPAGTGGGADIQARFMAPLVEKYKLSPQPFIPVNRSAGAGAQAFIYMKQKAGDPHNLLITLDNLFATPLAQPDLGFSWRQLTPVCRLLLDEFVLTVHSDSPWKSVAEFQRAAKAAPPGSIKMAGTGSKQEDEIIMVLLENAWDVDFTYIPFPGGGAVAAALVGKQVDFTVNNPLEMVGQWDAGRLRPLAIFDTERIKAKKWAEIPTMKELGFNIDYLMLRGVFMPSQVPPESVAFYQEVFRRLMGVAEMRDFIELGAFKKAFLCGNDFTTWLVKKSNTVQNLMIKGGLITR